MQHRLLTRAGAALFAAALVVAACGDDDTETTTEPAADADVSDDSADPSTDHTDDESHSHDRGTEIGDQDVIPTLAVTAVPDARSGVNLRASTTGFTFAPEHASTDHVEGEGHAHVYVDGEKLGRVYTEWTHLAIEPGEHEIRVDLNANNHSPLLVDGEPIDETVSVEVPESAGGHAHGEAFEASEPVPGVDLTVRADPKSGWNVHVETTDFTFVPDKASTMETTSGEGHAHLYVDGEKITRMYGNWFHFSGELGGGAHEFRVELSANDHSPYASGGDLIEDRVTITVEGPPAEADRTIEVEVVDGVVANGGRHEVALGDTVAIVVTSDEADEVHVHGYDVFGDVPAGGTTTVVFTADIPGVFEVELEGAGVPLVELEIS